MTWTKLIMAALMLPVLILVGVAAAATAAVHIL